MGKRKRKKSGGGAFGKTGAKRLARSDAFGFEDIEWRYIDRDRSTTFDLIRHWNAAAGIDPRVDEAMEKSSILDAIDDGTLETPPAFQARRVLDRIYEEELSGEEIQGAIDAALEIDPGSIDARLVFAEQADSPEVTRERYREAVETGEARLAAKLATGTPPEDGWAADMEVLPFLNALLRLAESCRSSGDVDGAIAGYERLIGIDPTDALDAIPSFSGLHLAQGRIDDAARLIESSPNRNSCAVLYDRAYLAFFAALEAAPDFEPDMERADPFELLRSPEMEHARELLHEAIRRSPWTVPFVFDCRTALLGPLVAYEEGSPLEALEYARSHFAPWTLLVVPAIWLNVECSRIVPRLLDRRHLRQHREAFDEAVEWLEDIEFPGDTLGDKTMKETCESFGMVAKRLRELIGGGGRRR